MSNVRPKTAVGVALVVLGSLMVITGTVLLIQCRVECTNNALANPDLDMWMKTPLQLLQGNQG